jgi:FkbM family methyltransferase
MGDRRWHRLVARLVRRLQAEQGIGTGASGGDSGEQVIVKLLREARAAGPDPLCVLDVGANKGQFLTMLLSELGETPAQVHAFEPGKEAFAALETAFGGDPRVTLQRMALGREPGEAVLHYDRPGSGLASLHKRRLDHFEIPFEGAEAVKVDTVDRYCERAAIRRIDLLKLDVEGHELEVLHGARRMLAQDAVRMVSFEFGGCNIDSRTFFQDFFYFFREHGPYRLFRVLPGGSTLPILGYDEGFEQFRVANYVAVRDAASPPPEATLTPAGSSPARA